MTGHVKSTPLAVISIYFGAPSETFIHRHMNDLLPDKTAIIVHSIFNGSSRPCQPHLEIKQRHCRWRLRLERIISVLLQSKLGPEQKMVRDFLVQQKVQVVMCEYLDFALQWMEAVRSVGIPFFAHAHGYDVSMTLRDPDMRRRYLQLNAADGIITMSEASRRRLIELGLDSAKVHSIPYGIDVPDSPVVRKQGPVFKCLAVGRMVAKKSPLLLLESFRQAIAIFPGMHLDYVGSGELLPCVKQFVSDHQLDKHVTLHGSLPNATILHMMDKADIFLQHSRTDPVTGDEEGLPVAILEAMGHGLPVISTRHAGIPEAVVEGVTGLLVDEGDTGGMAECLVQLASDAGLRGRFGLAGWQRAKERFTWQRERQELLAVLGIADQCSNAHAP